MQTEHIEINWDLYPAIEKFLVTRQDTSSMDTLHLLKLEIAERLARKVPDLRHPDHKEALMLGVEMKFAAIQCAFAQKERRRAQEEEDSYHRRKQAEETLLSHGFFEVPF